MLQSKMVYSASWDRTKDGLGLWIRRTAITITLVGRFCHIASTVDLTLGPSVAVGADLDFSNPDVVQDVFDWGTWVVQETGHVGFRFDAIKVGILFYFMLGGPKTYDTSSQLIL